MKKAGNKEKLPRFCKTQNFSVWVFTA